MDNERAWDLLQSILLQKEGYLLRVLFGAKSDQVPLQPVDLGLVVPQPLLDELQPGFKLQADFLNMASGDSTRDGTADGRAAGAGGPALVSRRQ